MMQQVFVLNRLNHDMADMLEREKQEREVLEAKVTVLTAEVVDLRETVRNLMYDFHTCKKNEPETPEKLSEESRADKGDNANTGEKEQAARLEKIARGREKLMIYRARKRRRLNNSCDMQSDLEAESKPLSNDARKLRDDIVKVESEIFAQTSFKVEQNEGNGCKALCFTHANQRSVEVSKKCPAKLAKDRQRRRVQSMQGKARVKKKQQNCQASMPRHSNKSMIPCCPFV
jgi:hypothetical protein